MDKTSKIVTILCARPQIIKAAAVSAVFKESVNEILVHTGQHYDPNMSQVFFDELEIPAPRYNLEVSGGGHGAMTGRMLEGIEHILLDEKPDWVLIYGDTNSTLAGALADARLPGLTIASQRRIGGRVGVAQLAAVDVDLREGRVGGCGTAGGRRRCGFFAAAAQRHEQRQQ